MVKYIRTFFFLRPGGINRYYEREHNTHTKEGAWARKVMKLFISSFLFFVFSFLELAILSDDSIQCGNFLSCGGFSFVSSSFVLPSSEPIVSWFLCVLLCCLAQQRRNEKWSLNDWVFAVRLNEEGSWSERDKCREREDLTVDTGRCSELDASPSSGLATEFR